MPALEMAQETGTLLRWLKAEGEQVQRGEPLMEIETDKVTLEIEAGGSGVLAQVSAAPGDEVPVGQVIALLLGEGEEAGALSPSLGSSVGRALTPQPPLPQGEGESVSGRRESLPAFGGSPTGRGALSAGEGRTADAAVAASPLARRLAAEHGVDLREVPTSGRISKAEVLAWLEQRSKADEAALSPDPGLSVGRALTPRTLSRLGGREPFPRGEGESVSGGRESLPAFGGSPSERGALTTGGRGALSANAGRLVLASPLARRLARERGIELAGLSGSGPDGAVLAVDVPVAAPVSEVAAAEMAGELRRVVPLTGMRGAIAARTQASAQAAPHIALTLSADMSAALQLQRQLSPAVEAASGHKLTLTTLLARVVAVTLGAHPRLNAHLLPEGIHEYRPVHLGVAVALDDGLLVPVIRDCETLGLAALQARLQQVAQRARMRQLTSSEMSGGTFTLSNLGMYGIEHFTAIINPPEVAILAAGAVQQRVVAVDGQPAVRPMLQMTINVDHRAVDGAVAAAFLRDVKQLLEDPWSLLV